MSKKSKYPEVSVYSVLPKPIILTRSMAQTQPNSINLDDAIQYLKTLPEEEQKVFNHHLMQIINLKDKFPNSPAIDTVMEHHINKGASGKTKRNKRNKRKKRKTLRKGKK